MGTGTLLITGAAGFAGWNLVQHFIAQGWSVVAGYNNTVPIPYPGVEWIHLPLTQPSLCATIEKHTPDAIVHCAAIPGVAACDNDPRYAFRVNVEATGKIAEAAESLQIPMVYLSTDLVFDGLRGWYDEEDCPNPPTYYGKTKLLGEQRVMTNCSRAYVLRLALSFGMARNCLGGFLQWTHEGLLHGKELRLFTNQYRSIFFMDDLGHIIERLLLSHGYYGIYHCGGPNRLNRFDIGTIFALQFTGVAQSIVPTQLQRTEYHACIDDTSMITTKLTTVTGWHFTEFREGIARIHREWLALNT